MPVAERLAACLAPPNAKLEMLNTPKLPQNVGFILGAREAAIELTAASISTSSIRSRRIPIPMATADCNHCPYTGLSSYGCEHGLPRRHTPRTTRVAEIPVQIEYHQGLL
jgi:hypothetical protein